MQNAEDLSEKVTLAFGFLRLKGVGGEDAAEKKRKMRDGVLSASVQAVLQGLPEHSALGGVQRKRVELLTLKLAPMAPDYHLLPRPEDLVLLCSQERGKMNFENERLAACGRERLSQFMTRAADTCVRSSEAWESIPPEVDPSTLLPPKRRERKRQQIMSLVRACAALMLLIDSSTKEPGEAGFDGREGEGEGGEGVGGGGHVNRVVDFAGGCGHTGVLLAWLFPAWEVVCVDTKMQSLVLGLERAEKLGLSNFKIHHGDIREYKQVISHSPRTRLF